MTTRQYLNEYIKSLNECIYDIKHENLKDHFSNIDIIARVSKNGIWSVIYKEGADFTKHPLTRLCRGLFFLLDEQVEIISFPFIKFFNYDEHKKLFPEEHKEKVKQLKNPIIAFDKLDGDIIKLSHYFNMWNFSSNNIPGQIPQQLTKFLKTYKIDFEKLDKNCTYIFEFTAPLTHVTYYDKPNLTLIGIKNNNTEKEIDITKLGEEYLGFTVAKFRKFKSIEKIFEFVESITSLDQDGAEGVVIYDDNKGDPIRFKVKSKWWLRQTRYSYSSIMISGVRSHFFDEKTKDSEDYKEICMYLPSVVKEVNKIANNIKEQVKTLMEKITYVKELEKKLRFKEMNKHPFGIVGMKFLEKEFTENDMYQELFRNTKTKNIIKQMIN